MPEDTDSVTLVGGQSTTGTLEWTPSVGDAGDWIADVQSANDSDWTDVEVTVSLASIITIHGDGVEEITYDGDPIVEITYDGDVIWGE